MESTTLTYGDYLIGNVIVERKTSEDFLASLYDGRLFRQLRELRNLGKRVILIYEGADIETLRIGRSALRGVLLTIFIDLQIPMLVTQNKEETAEMLLSIALKIGKQRRTRLQRVRYGAKPLDLERSQLYILAGLPGIGNARAINLLRQFGSLEAVFTAPIKELEKVPDIGPVLAQQIFGLARSSWSRDAAPVIPVENNLAVDCIQERS